MKRLEKLANKLTGSIDCTDYNAAANMASRAAWELLACRNTSLAMSLIQDELKDNQELQDKLKNIAHDLIVEKSNQVIYKRHVL